MARRHIRPGLFTLDLAQGHEVHGPVRCVNAACVSGLLAIQQAVSLIRRNLADTVAVVGVDMASHLVLMGFTKLQALAPDGCRPFDRDRVGLSLGEGAGALILSRPERLPQASFVVSGGGSSNDANHLTGPSRDGSGLALAIEAALRDAGRDPGVVDYAHVHGTGTPYNDNMEALALRRVFGDHAPPFSGSKGMLGHTLAAAGVLETLLCLLAADQQLLPGTPRLIHPDPVAPRSLVSQPRRADRLQCLLKTNCGFAGTNAAIVLERMHHASTSTAGSP
jgi:3-oxoacyl-(acyl-carrier-protein) synthase